MSYRNAIYIPTFQEPQFDNGIPTTRYFSYSTEFEEQEESAADLLFQPETTETSILIEDEDKKDITKTKLNLYKVSLWERIYQYIYSLFFH